MRLDVWPQCEGVWVGFPANCQRPLRGASALLGHPSKDILLRPPLVLTSSKPENEQAVLTPLGYLNRTLLWKHEGSSAAITVTSGGAVTKMPYHLESRVCGFQLPFAA